jgi:hypothetical protein
MLCCCQEEYAALIAVRPTLGLLMTLFMQSLQQSILSEPVTRALESLLYGTDHSSAKGAPQMT